MKESAIPDPLRHHLGAFEFVVLVLSIMTLGMIVADTFFVLPHEISRILDGIDFAACLVFLVDFVHRFHKAESKLDFMKLGWIDLLSSIPNLAVFRVGRFVRILRVLRLLRGIRSVERIVSLFFHHKHRTGMTSIFLTVFLMIGFSSIGILVCENGPEANIKTAGDAVWWSVTTMTTVGYGDRYPVTMEGRVLAMTLMLAGVGLFGTVSGLVASMFVGRSSEDSDVLNEVRELRRELAELRRLHEQSNRASSGGT